MSNIWRLIKTPPERGSWNMAVDEAILEAVGDGKVQPTLRLYAWNPACLSLGYAQPYSDVDISRLESNGWEIVRRVTGGRAILHTDELTYSVTGPPDEPRLTGGVLESYRRLSQALLEALLDLSLPAEALPKTPGLDSNTQTKEPVCFEVPSNYEITIRGKKIIGSAQARRKHAVLQHGTLPLFGDLTRITKVLSFPNEKQRNEAAGRLLQRATTIENVINRTVSWEEAAEAIARAFEKILNVKLISSKLTPDELSQAKKLVKEKYAHPNWTERI